MERRSTSRAAPWFSRLSTRLRAISSGTVYVRAGTGFTVNGVGQTFNFNTPDVGFGKTQRLGNENDFYIETGPILDHMLGDDPDVIDVKVKMTFQFFDSVDKQVGLNLDQ